MRLATGLKIATVVMAIQLCSVTKAQEPGEPPTPESQQQKLQPVPYQDYVIPGYVKLNAPLNPTPRPDIPHQMGGAMITNQAFYPQEMLYPHEYNAMYGPYYYRVSGKWKVTPWGVRSYEHWELLGTKVRVRYKSKISPFSGFVTP